MKERTETKGTYTTYHFFLSVWWNMASPMAQRMKNPPTVQETQELWVCSLGWENSLEKEMATHSSILAWKIPWTVEPGGVQFMGSLRDRTERLSTHTRLSRGYAKQIPPIHWLLKINTHTYTHTHTHTHTYTCEYW